jgi:major histocompatibility complex class I
MWASGRSKSGYQGGGRASIRKEQEWAIEPGVVAHAFNPSTWEAEAGRFLSSRPAWSTE